MHELAAVATLMETLRETVPDERPGEVACVRLRRGSAFSEEALRQGFELLARGTRFERARLEVETVDLVVECDCGLARRVTADDLVGHMYVCAACGAVRDLKGVDELALVGVVLVTDEPEGPGRRDA
ncbi:MAG: hydrogenase maturation nickel metallochaperone HypA [Chloroflexi bacterium]|nr:hydrogenase maturation nickel metallochaperone HypA [Chloroflexota bacterium]